MSNYVKSVNFAAKDALTPGDPLKVAKGTEINTEFDNIATAIATKEDTANKDSPNGYPGLDASSLISDSRLSTNIARLASANVFTASQTISGTTPQFFLYESDGAANNRYWVMLAASEQLRFAAENDAHSTTTSWCEVDRTGTTIDVINFKGTALQFNGNGLFTTANDGAGSSLDADLLDGQQGSFYTSATNLTSGTIPDGRVPASAITQHNSSINGRNITGKSGTGKTLSTSAPAGGADGDIWYRY